MRGACIVMLISLSVLALAEGLRVSPLCPRACTREYRPLCAVLKRNDGTIRSVCTFSNKCTLGNQICLTGQNWQVKHEDRKCWRESSDCDAIRK